MKMFLLTRKALETESVLNLQLSEYLCPKYVDYCVLLGYYAASSGNFLPMFWDNFCVFLLIFVCSVYFCVVLCILCCSMYRLFCDVLCIVCVFVCTVLLPPGGYPIVVKYIISYHIISYHIISYHIISYHIISYHIISYHIISYHII